MLVRMAGLVEGLVVRTERMRENIERGLGLHASSRVLVALVERAGLSREEAYAIVQRAALRAADERRPLRELLAVDPTVAQKLRLADLDACFDDAAFLRHVPAVIARLDSLEARGPCRPLARSPTRSCAPARSATCTQLDDDRLLLVASDRHQRVRRRPADADPGQGPRADRPVAVLVRARRPAIVPNHLLGDRPRTTVAAELRHRRAGRSPDELRGRMMICRRADVLPIEVVVRGYLAGSGWKDYRERGAVCGIAAARRACARATACPSRSSRRRPRPSGRARREHRASTRWSTACDRRLRPTAAAALPATLATLAPLPVRGGGRASAAGIILADTKFEFGVEPDDRRADPHRRGPDARLVALLGRRDLRAGPARRRASTSSSSATGSRRSRGTRRAPGPELPADVVDGHPRSATSRRSSGSPARASTATWRRTRSPDERRLPVRGQRHAEGRDPRPAGPGGRGQPRPPRDRGRLRRAGRPAGRADGRPPTTRRRRGRSSSGWPRSSCRTRSSSRTTVEAIGAASSTVGAPRMTRPDRRRRLPGLELRHRRGQRARGRRRRAGPAVARAGVPRRRRRRHPAGRLRVRRLPARGRDRPVQPGHARRSPAFAADGGLVLGICNGFQVLAEAQLLPGALLRNRGLRFVSREVAIVPERLDTPFTRAIGGAAAAADADRPRRGLLLRRRRDARRARARRPGPVPLRRRRRDDRRTRPATAANPNGSLRAIAGVMNAAGNVAGLMPHPETARRGDPRLGRRARDHPLARRERRRASGRRRARRGRRAMTLAEPRGRTGRSSRSTAASA